MQNLACAHHIPDGEIASGATVGVHGDLVSAQVLSHRSCRLRFQYRVLLLYNKRNRASDYITQFRDRDESINTERCRKRNKTEGIHSKEEMERLEGR